MTIDYCTRQHSRDRSVSSTMIRDGIPQTLSPVGGSWAKRAVRPMHRVYRQDALASSARMHGLSPAPPPSIGASQR
jgi:hypothetical protein